MQRLDKQYLECLRREWVGGGGIKGIGVPLKRGTNIEKINEWVLNLLNKEEFSEHESSIVECLWHGMNCDIPPGATRLVREELVRILLMKVEDPNRDVV
ncbi:hypothetical protein [Xanthobacter autotrophicus]|uniref:hypothetical protein n=1 Tax=Xanthobacter autotrophicus TaxID=280 RepID=UPI00372C24D7